MPRRDSDPDFVESIARGFDVLKAFDRSRPVMSLSEVAAVTGLARPTARRILRTLEAIGYVRSAGGSFELTPRVLELGVTYVQSLGLWDVARPHLEDLVAKTHESSSVAQLDGSDIVYVARVAVPKLIALAVHIGTRFPAVPTSLGKVLLAGLDPEELDRVLREVRAQGWALTDEQLASGIRSAAAPLRDGSGRVVAAVNVTVHAAETSLSTLREEYLPMLLDTAGRISADFALRDALPQAVSGTLSRATPR